MKSFFERNDVVTILDALCDHSWSISTITLDQIGFWDSQILDFGSKFGKSNVDFETSRIDSKFRPEWFRVGKTHPEVTGYRNTGPEALQRSENLCDFGVVAS